MLINDLLVSLKGVRLCCFTVVENMAVSNLKAFLIEGWNIVEMMTAMHSHTMQERKVLWV